jgi:3-phenylpropionate/trans-cinnamate dioxygenase alpha subunit
LDFLGAAGRLGIDLLAERGDMVVVPGIRKFVIDCNWKFALDNLFDWYHPQITHASAFQSGAFPDGGGGSQTATVASIDTADVATQDGGDLGLSRRGISGTEFDQVVVLGEYGHAIGGPTHGSAGEVDFNPAWRDTPAAREALGPVGITVAGHPSVFPSTWVASSNEISLRIPRSANTTEIWWFSFVDRNLPPPVRDFAVNWAQSTMQTRGTGARRVKHLVNMGVGRGKVIKEHGLARIEGLTSEYGQLWTYYAWAQWMKGGDWNELRAVTEPPDTM